MRTSKNRDLVFLIGSLVIAAIALGAVVFAFRVDGRVERIDQRTLRLDSQLAEQARNIEKILLDLAAQKREIERVSQLDRLSSVEESVRVAQGKMESLRADDLTELGLDDVVGNQLGLPNDNERAYAPLPRLAEKAPHRRPRTLDDLRATFGLSEKQTREVGALINRAKDRVNELATTKREDGSNLMMDMAAAMKGRAPLAQKARRAFRKLFTESPPGSEGNYFNALVEIRRDAWGDLGAVLSPSQLNQFKASRTSLFGIKSGYMPRR